MGSIPDDESTKVDAVCIIGGGPSGLAAAKYLRAEGTFSRIVVFEQRKNIGGLWNYTPYPDDYQKEISVPQTNPNAGHHEPMWHHRPLNEAPRGEELPQTTFMSPIYDRLETNIPRELMGFSDLEWPTDCPLFPKHEEVLDYLERYAEDVRHFIEFDTQVIDVSLNSDGLWTVKTQKLSPDKRCTVEQHNFGAVLVANGHFNVPYIPSIAGIEAWNKAYPGSILHSKFYRAPERYSGKKVVVVGNSASGLDIAAQIAGFCKPPLPQSQKSLSYLKSEQSPTKIEKPEIAEFILQDRSVRFSDGSIESNIDAIIYCTGYFYSYPFLKSLEPPIITTGEHVENTFQHIFYRPNPTLAFAVLNQKVIPFPMAEGQSAVIARVWSGRLNLPCEGEMAEWEEKTLKETGGGRDFHLLKFPKDADYLNMCHDWAMTASGEANVVNELSRRRMSSSAIYQYERPSLNGLKTSGGKEPPYWAEREYWMRERFPAIKKAFQSFGEERDTKRTIEDVGFDFEEWKRERIEEGRKLL